MNLQQRNQPHSLPDSGSYLDEKAAKTVPLVKGKNVARHGFTEQTPLSIFVRQRLVELGLKQSAFCRLHAFDQGMLSRIQHSMVCNLNLESVLKLAIGLRVSPLTILALIGRPDLHDLVMNAYAKDVPELMHLKFSPDFIAPPSINNSP